MRGVLRGAKFFIWILAVISFVFLLGCGNTVPTSKQTKTVKTYDENQKLVQETIIKTDEAVPEPMSDEVARMVKACYESFDDSQNIPSEYLAKMDSGDIKDVLIFKEYRYGVREAYGYTPAQVCQSPKTIYDYAIAHDEQLFLAIRSGIKDFTGLGPWAAGAYVLGKGYGAAGDKVGGDKVGGDQLKAGRDQKVTYEKKIDTNQPQTTTVQTSLDENGTTGGVTVDNGTSPVGSDMTD